MSEVEQLRRLCEAKGWRAGIQEPGNIWLSECLPQEIAEIGDSECIDIEVMDLAEYRSLYVADNSLLFVLVQRLDWHPHSYRVGVYPPWCDSAVPTLRIDGQVYWGSGEKWEIAETMMAQALGVEIVPASRVRFWFLPEDIEYLSEDALDSGYELSDEWRKMREKIRDNND